MHMPLWRRCGRPRRPNVHETNKEALLGNRALTAVTVVTGLSRLTGISQLSGLSLVRLPSLSLSSGQALELSRNY